VAMHRACATCTKRAESWAINNNAHPASSPFIAISTCMIKEFHLRRGSSQLQRMQVHIDVGILSRHARCDDCFPRSASTLTTGFRVSTISIPVTSLPLLYHPSQDELCTTASLKVIGHLYGASPRTTIHTYIRDRTSRHRPTRRDAPIAAWSNIRRLGSRTLLSEGKVQEDISLPQRLSGAQMPRRSLRRRSNWPVSGHSSSLVAVIPSVSRRGTSSEPGLMIPTVGSAPATTNRPVQPCAIGVAPKSCGLGYTGPWARASTISGCMPGKERCMLSRHLGPRDCSC
jgi:hypothetical protein